MALPTGMLCTLLLHLGTCQCCSHYCSLRSRAPSEKEGGRDLQLGKLQSALLHAETLGADLAPTSLPTQKRTSSHERYVRRQSARPRDCPVSFVQTPGAPCGRLSLPCKSSDGVLSNAPAPGTPQEAKAKEPDVINGFGQPGSKCGQ